jgi:hypothetical protein
MKGLIPGGEERACKEHKVSCKYAWAIIGISAGYLISGSQISLLFVTISILIVLGISTKCRFGVTISIVIVPPDIWGSERNALEGEALRFRWRHVCNWNQDNVTRLPQFRRGKLSNFELSTAPSPQAALRGALGRPGGCRRALTHVQKSQIERAGSVRMVLALLQLYLHLQEVSQQGHVCVAVAVAVAVVAAEVAGVAEEREEVAA